MCGPDDRNRFRRPPQRHGWDEDVDYPGRCNSPSQPGYRPDFGQRSRCRDEEFGRHPGPPPMYEDECCPPRREHGASMLDELVSDLHIMVQESAAELVREKIMEKLEEKIGDKLDLLVDAVVDSHLEELASLMKGKNSLESDLAERLAEILAADEDDEDEDDDDDDDDDEEEEM